VRALLSTRDDDKGGSSLLLDHISISVRVPRFLLWRSQRISNEPSFATRILMRSMWSNYRGSSCTCLCRNRNDIVIGPVNGKESGVPLARSSSVAESLTTESDRTKRSWSGFELSSGPSMKRLPSSVLALDDRSCRRSWRMIDGKSRHGNRAWARLGPINTISSSASHVPRAGIANARRTRCQPRYATYRSEFLDPRWRGTRPPAGTPLRASSIALGILRSAGGDSGGELADAAAFGQLQPRRG